MRKPHGAGRATQAAAENLASELRAFASAATGIIPEACVLDNDAAVCGRQRLSFAQISEAARAQGQLLRAAGTSAGTPRSVAFNVQAFRIAVNKHTGAIKLLRSDYARRRDAVARFIQEARTVNRIRHRNIVDVPDIVELYIPQREQTLRARVSWRRNDEIGLAFTEVEQRVADTSPTASEIVQRVALLEAEITSLRSMLKRMKAETAGGYDEAVA